MADERENAIEWINGQNRVTVTLSQGRYISKVKKLAMKFPDEVQIVKENEDGTILAHIPLNYIKINRASRDLTEEEREVMMFKEKIQYTYHSSSIKKSKVLWQVYQLFQSIQDLVQSFGIHHPNRRDRRCSENPSFIRLFSSI